MQDIWCQGISLKQLWIYLKDLLQIIGGSDKKKE